jgi:hypothetical protein
MEDLDWLRSAFDAEPGTFLSALQVDLVWDAAAFERLVTAMEAACVRYADSDELPRWLVAGFWYTADAVPLLIQDPRFVRRRPARYYEQACGRLWELNAWFAYGRPV